LAQEFQVIRPKIPIILCTGSSQGLTPGAIKPVWIRECLMKPLIVTDLTNALRRVLEE